MPTKHDTNDLSFIASGNVLHLFDWKTLFIVESNLSSKNSVEDKQSYRKVWRPEIQKKKGLFHFQLRSAFKASFFHPLCLIYVLLAPTKSYNVTIPLFRLGFFFVAYDDM